MLWPLHTQALRAAACPHDNIMAYRVARYVIPCLLITISVFADLILRQWQRIAISRAFMRADRPEVDLLLFDEPVSDTPQLYICRHESASLTGLGRHHHWTHMHRIKFSIPYIVSQGPHQATRQKLSSSLPTDFPPRVVPIRSR